MEEIFNAFAAFSAGGAATSNSIAPCELRPRYRILIRPRIGSRYVRMPSVYLPGLGSAQWGVQVSVPGADLSGPHTNAKAEGSPGFRVYGIGSKHFRGRRHAGLYGSPRSSDFRDIPEEVGGELTLTVCITVLRE